MTFDEYNTDEVFNGDSTADELVKLAKNEGKTREDVEKSLSPKWKEDKKGNVKKALDKYFTVEEPKKEAPKVEEMTQTTEALEQPKAEKKKSNLDDETKSYMDVNSEIANTAEDEENDRQAESLEKRWGARLANIDKMSDSMSKIDDHLIDQLPTFMFKRYQNGEFGDISDTSTPEGRASKRNAQLRLAYFAMNNVVSKLKKLYNADSIVRGQGPIFNDTESAYDKYQQTNLEQGLQNRWNKYKQETQSAIDLAKQGGMSEEAITDSIATISANNRLQSKFNMMNERQKVFALQVLGEVGGKLGNMNDAQFANTLMGMSAMGDSLDPKEAAGMLIYRFVKDPEKRKAALSELGLVSGGIGGGLGGIFGGNKDKSEEAETGTTLEDGTKIDPGKRMSKDELEQLRTEAEKLGNKFYNGEMTEEEFRKEYAKLEGVMKQHGIRNAISGGILSQDAYIKQIVKNKLTELSDNFYDLNDNAKNYTKDEYLKKYDELKSQAVKWGISEKDLKSVEKEKEKALKKIKK